MAIDFNRETLVSLNEASRRLPPGRNGRPVHVSTLVRGITQGELEAVKIGKRWVTSVEALQRWAERRTAAAMGRPPPRSPSQRDRDDARARERLNQLGL
jgi:hypothetical protein